MRNAFIFLCGLQLWQSCCVRPEHDLEELDESTSTETKTGHHLTPQPDGSTSTKTNTGKAPQKSDDDGGGDGWRRLNIERCKPSEASATFAAAMSSILDAYNATESVKAELLKTVETNSKQYYMTYGLTRDLTEAMYLYRSDLNISSDFKVKQQMWYQLVNAQLRQPNKKFTAFCPYLLLLQLALSSVNKLPPSYVFRGEGGSRRGCPKKKILTWKWEGFTSTSPSISRAALFSNADKTSGPGPLWIFKTSGTRAREITDLQAAQQVDAAGNREVLESKWKREILFPPTRFRVVTTLAVGTKEQCQGRDKFHDPDSDGNEIVRLHMAKIDANTQVVCEFFDPVAAPDCKFDCHKGRWYEMWDSQYFGAKCIGILEEVSATGIPVDPAATADPDQEALAIMGKATDVAGSAAVADDTATADTAAAIAGSASTGSASTGSASSGASGAGATKATSRAGAATQNVDYRSATIDGLVLHREPHSPAATPAGNALATEQAVAAADEDASDHSYSDSGWMQEHAVILLAVGALFVLAISCWVFNQKPSKKSRRQTEQSDEVPGDPDSHGYAQDDHPGSGHDDDEAYLEYSKFESDDYDHGVNSPAEGVDAAADAASTGPTAPDASEGTKGTGAESSDTTAVAVPVATAVAAPVATAVAAPVDEFSPVPVVASPERRLSPIVPPLPSKPLDATADAAPVS